MSLDQTLKNELKGILSQTQYDKIKGCLEMKDNYATIAELDTSNFFTQTQDIEN